MKRSVVVGISLVLMLIAVNGAVWAQTDLQVTNTAGEALGAFVGIYDDDADSWIVYNPIMERLMVFGSTHGTLAVYLEGCPYFDTGTCTGEPYLEEDWWRWVTQCDNRFFMSLEDFGVLDTPPDSQLDVPGNCGPTTSTTIVVEAQEILESDFPFQLGLGPLELVPGGAAQSVVAVPAVSRTGLAVLALLVAGGGYLLIRRSRGV